MKRTFILLSLGAVLIGGATTADALPITPGGTSCTTSTNSNLSGTQVLAIVDACFDADATALQLLYKAQVGGSDSGAFASSYNTTFTNTATDPQNAFVRYISGASISCTECYLVIKDGNHLPAQVLL